MVNRLHLGIAVALVVTCLLLAANAHAALVGYWDFNEGSGRIAYDFSPNNNTGDFKGTGSSYEAGRFPTDTALRINSGANFVEVPHSASLASITNQFTIAMWVREMGGTNYGHLVTTTNDYASRRWLFQTGAWSGQNAYVWSDADNRWHKSLGWSSNFDTWTHVALTYDGTSLRGYRNGALMSTQGVSGGADFPSFTQAILLGGGTAGNSSYNGRIDDVVIFNSVETDLAAIMAGTHPDMVRSNWLAGQEWSKRISIGRTGGAPYNAVYSTTSDTAPGGPTVGVLANGGTTARLWGTGTASSATTVNMQWRARYEDELDFAGGGLVSDVLDLTGIAALGGSATDEFVLAMSYQSTLPTYLAFWDDAIDEWIPAVDGNFGGTANYLGETAFLAGTHGLGDYGYQYDGQAGQWYAWAVLNHNSQFAVFAVPEPGACLLLLLALTCGLLVRWRR